MLPKREIKNIYVGKDAQAKVLKGVTKMEEVVGTSYGSSGLNVILGMPFGDPTLTRDGVTIAKRTILPDRAEDDAASVLRQASEKTNRSAGDGTTATIVHGANLYFGGHQRISAGESGMLIKKQIIEDSKKVIAFIKEQSTEITLDDKGIDKSGNLLAVATVSAGDPAIGKLIAKTIQDVGENGGISIREQNYPTIDVEKVNGYYFDRGFFALNQPMEFAKPHIFVTQKAMSSNADIIPLLSAVINDDKNKNLVIVGDVRMNSEAMNTLLLNISQNKLLAVVVPPPAFDDAGLLFMQDIALYVGAPLFVAGDDMKNFTKDYLGSAERVQVTQDKAIIFKGSGADEDIEKRAAEIKEQIATEKSSHRKDQLEQRYSKLVGKISIINVGGSTPTEMEELRYRVEDAIEATRSALKDGVLPGGGTILVHASELDISPLYKKALLDSFRRLMNNAEEPADYRIEQIKNAEVGFGINLRAVTKEPIDLRKAGIFDATRAVVQTIENATSAAASLLTVGVIVDPIDQDDKETNQQPQN